MSFPGGGDVAPRTIDAAHFGRPRLGRPLGKKKRLSARFPPVLRYLVASGRERAQASSTSERLSLG